LPLLIVTTPPGQLHEFGALMAAATAVENGWEVVYLGPNLPAEEIAAAARQRGADAVALSIIYPSGDPRLRREMHRLRQFLGPDIPILVGGRAAAAYRETLSEIRAVHLADLDALHEQLERFAG
jgi:methylmalonyl-CoA mutase cobalamin-binding subunit